MKNRKCPLCDSPLTEGRYREVIKIQEEKDKVQKGDLDKLKKQLAVKDAAVANANKKTKEANQRAKQAEFDGRKKGEEFAKKKYGRLFESQSATIKKLKEKNRQLQQGTTPQEIGLADEKVLVNRLKKEFPDDDIKLEGKECDVLHFVKFDRERVGCIAYECKHTSQIAIDHIRQISRDKKTRHADYGILVTTGTRKGFSGLAQEEGVFIVAQAAVLALARLCRDSLITMAKQKLDADAKEAAAKRLMNYITSPVCKNPLEEAISHTGRARKNLEKEIKQHFGDWRERYEIYETIRYDVSHIQTCIERVLNGEEPLKLQRQKFQPLALLPART